MINSKISMEADTSVVKERGEGPEDCRIGPGRSATTTRSLPSTKRQRRAQMGLVLVCGTRGM